MRVITLSLLTALLLLCACQRQEQNETDAPKSNVLRDYIRTPIDKAKGVNQASKDRQKRIADMMGEEE